MVRIELELDDEVARRLGVLCAADDGLPDVEAVIARLADHAQQGVYRPGSWEHGWLLQAFGYDWLGHDDEPGQLSGDGNPRRPRMLP